MICCGVHICFRPGRFFIATNFSICDGGNSPEMKTKCVITVPQLFFTKQPLPSAVSQVPSCCFVLCVGNVSTKIAVIVIYIYIFCVCVFVFRVFSWRKNHMHHPKTSAMCNLDKSFFSRPLPVGKHGFFELPHFLTKPRGVLLEQAQPGACTYHIDVWKVPGSSNGF